MVEVWAVVARAVAEQAAVATGAVVLAAVEKAAEGAEAEGTAVLLVSGKAPQAAMLVRRSALRKYIRALHAQDAAGRCNAKKTACKETPPEAELPCVTRCNEDGGDAARRGACSEAYTQLGMRACATRVSRSASVAARPASAKVRDPLPWGEWGKPPGSDDTLAMRTLPRRANWNTVEVIK